MSREVNWLKCRLAGAKTAVKAARTNERVSLFVRQALEAAESGLDAALSYWGAEPLTNGEKSWREIMMEISRKHSVLWHYVTALRGPDPVDCSCTAKAIFTCPLRGRCVYALGKEEFHRLSPEEIKEGFATVYECRHKLRHYLQHVVAVWEVFYPPLGELLASTFLKGSIPGISPKEAARRYIKLLNEWMQSRHVIIVKGEDHEKSR